MIPTRGLTALSVTLFAGNLVGVTSLSQIPAPDRTVTLQDVLGSKCSQVQNADCAKILADVYQGLVLPYW